jgi:transposase
MKPTCIDLRKRIVAARIEDGQSMGQIARRFKIPKGTVQNILERHRDSGGVQPKPPNSGRKPMFVGQVLERLEQDVRLHPDATLAELRDRSGLAVSTVAVHRALRRLGFTLKKNLYMPANSSAPTLPRGARPGANG